MLSKLSTISTRFQQSALADLYREKSGFYANFTILSEDIYGKKSVLALAKASSIKDIQSTRLEAIIKNYDYRIIVNSVDLEQLEFNSDISFDTQITTRVDRIDGISPVLPCELLEKFKVKSLCVNSTKQYKNGLSLYRYYNLFKSYKKKFLRITDSKSLISDNPNDYLGHGLTIIAPIINECLTSNTVESLCLLGVDFFNTGYLDMLRVKKETEQNTFYDLHACSKNPRQTHGLPLLRYINKLLYSEKLQSKFRIEMPYETETSIPDDIKSSLLKSNRFTFI